MSSFPTLQTGAVAQYPTVREQRREAAVLRFVDGSEQRYRDSGNTTRRWMIRLDQLDEEELAAIERLFDEAQGRAGSFAFKDPLDGSVYENCSFDEDELTIARRDEDQSATVVIVRENRN